MKRAFILGGITLGLPLLAEDSSADSLKKSLDIFESIGIDLKSIILFFAISMILGLVITLLFLRSISLFAKSMKLSNSLKETSGVWIWTQLVPLWGYIAMPITLLKLNEQYKTYVLENSSTQIKAFSPTWGWILFINSILSAVMSFFPEIIPGVELIVYAFLVVNLVSFIIFWVHVSKVRKSIVANLKI